MAAYVTCKSVTFRLRASFIHLNHVVPALQRLEELFEQQCPGAEPEHLMLIGDPGTGKSTLLRHFVGVHPKIRHESFDEVPVVYVDIPSRCSVSKLAAAMLQDLGARYWNQGDDIDLTHQVETLLRETKVKMIILDEVNHLVDRGALKSHYNVGDWIKSLGSKASIPIVLAGVRRSRTLLMINEQLGDRYSEVISLPTLSLADGETAKNSRATLKAFATLLEGVPTIDLTSSTVAPLMIFATGGRLRPLRKLLVRAVEIAFKAKDLKIDLAVLAGAFEQVIYAEAPRDRNPFCAEFNGIPLTKPGEPFSILQSQLETAKTVKAA